MALTTVPVELANLDGAVTINEAGADADFRIEGDSQQNLFVVNGGTDDIGIGMSDPTFATGNGMQFADDFYLGFGTGNGTRPDFTIHGDNNGLGIACGTGADTVDVNIDTDGNLSATKLTSNNGVLELDNDGSHNGVINAYASLFINIDTDSNSSGEIFSIAKDRTATSGGTELFRIQEDGNVGIGVTDPGNVRLRVENNVSGDFNAYFLQDHASGYGLGVRSDSGNQMFFYIGGTHQGTISSSGGTTAYGTSSDYRLKENVVDLSNGITRLKELKPKQFNFIADETNTLRDGFLAHEAQEVVPEAVAGEKDAEINDKGIGYQQMDYGKITPLLTAALQEAIAKIETLEAKVKALEEA